LVWRKFHNNAEYKLLGQSLAGNVVMTRVTRFGEFSCQNKKNQREGNISPPPIAILLVPRKPKNRVEINFLGPDRACKMQARVGLGLNTVGSGFLQAWVRI
jgi:hypothetical protein